MVAICPECLQELQEMVGDSLHCGTIWSVAPHRKHLPLNFAHLFLSSSDNFCLGVDFLVVEVDVRLT